MQEYTFEDQLIFNLDDDGDRSESFRACWDYLEKTLHITPDNSYGGWHDAAYFHFTYDGLPLRLEYNGMLGTELRCPLSSTEDQIAEARKLAHQLLAVIQVDNRS